MNIHVVQNPENMSTTFWSQNADISRTKNNDLISTINFQDSI